jgi:hypothetical protein
LSLPPKKNALILAIANGPVLIGKYKFFSVPDTPGGLRQPSVGFPAALLPNTTGVAGLAYPYMPIRINTYLPSQLRCLGASCLDDFFHARSCSGGLTLNREHVFLCP